MTVVKIFLKTMMIGIIIAKLTYSMQYVCIPSSNGNASTNLKKSNNVYNYGDIHKIPTRTADKHEVKKVTMCK